MADDIVTFYVEVASINHRFNELIFQSALETDTAGLSEIAFTAPLFQSGAVHTAQIEMSLAHKNVIRFIKSQVASVS